MLLLFDAANTLIYKPSFYTSFIDVLYEENIKVEINDFIKLHKIISECYQFPDRTSENFYHDFNREVLYALGIISTERMLKKLYNKCSYLKWEKFEDVNYIFEIDCPKSVLSNFHNGLGEILSKLFPGEFTNLTISENEDMRKPEIGFYKRAIETLGVKPNEIIYIGDSIKLDLEPALNSGMNAWLIDRNNYYPNCKRRIKSFKELSNLF